MKEIVAYASFLFILYSGLAHSSTLKLIPYYSPKQELRFMELRASSKTIQPLMEEFSSLPTSISACIDSQGCKVNVNYKLFPEIPVSRVMLISINIEVCYF
jgi:hypothetical protein